MKIYLIRHAESSPSKETPESQWPLSEKGRGQAEDLVSQLKNINIDLAFSSPYPRAIDTIQPLATNRNLTVKTIDEFRERKLSEGMIDNWLEELEQTWKDFDYKLPRGESSNECQKRFYDALKIVTDKYKGKNIAIASHGNAIALFLNRISSSFTFDDWKQMGNPDVYEVNYLEEEFKYVKRFIL